MEEEKQEKDSRMFIKHILGLQSGALMFMGKIINPMTGEPEKDIRQAKDIIDTLVTLREKTKNNLSENEERVLNDTITQLQYNFVDETILKKRSGSEEEKSEDGNSEKSKTDKGGNPDKENTDKVQTKEPANHEMDDEKNAEKK